MDDTVEISLFLVSAPDDFARFGAEYQAELRHFRDGLKAASMAVSNQG